MRLNYNTETKDEIHVSRTRVSKYILSYTVILKCRDKLEDIHTLSKVVDLTSHLNNSLKMLITQDKLFLRLCLLIILTSEV